MFVANDTIPDIEVLWIEWSFKEADTYVRYRVCRLGLLGLLFAWWSVCCCCFVSVIGVFKCRIRTTRRDCNGPEWALRCCWAIVIVTSLWLHFYDVGPPLLKDLVILFIGWNIRLPTFRSLNYTLFDGWTIIGQHRQSVGQPNAGAMGVAGREEITRTHIWSIYGYVHASYKNHMWFIYFHIWKCPTCGQPPYMTYMFHITQTIFIIYASYT
jgi:hypothetical protein